MSIVLGSLIWDCRYLYASKCIRCGWNLNYLVAKRKTSKRDATIYPHITQTPQFWRKRAFSYFSGISRSFNLVRVFFSWLFLKVYLYHIHRERPPYTVARAWLWKWTTPLFSPTLLDVCIKRSRARHKHLRLLPWAERADSSSKNSLPLQLSWMCTISYIPCLPRLCVSHFRVTNQPAMLGALPVWRWC